MSLGSVLSAKRESKQQLDSITARHPGSLGGCGVTSAVKYVSEVGTVCRVTTVDRDTVVAPSHR